MNLLALISKNERSAVSSILLVIGFVLIGMVVGNLIAGFVMITLSGLGIEDIFNINAAIMSSPNGWWAMILGQGVAAIFTFIIPGLIYWKSLEKNSFQRLGLGILPSFKTLIIVFILMLLFAPFNGWVQSLNQNLIFPESLSGLEKFIKEMEENLAELTQFFTKFDSPIQLIAALIIIAGIAGIGEELIFRGLIQRKLHLGLNNPHIAIWLSAAIFSAIHFQFYGFLPRMFLGAMFGYFFYFTGNLWVPIIAHIFNNGLAVILIDLVNKKKISPEVEKLDSVPWYMVVSSTILFFLVFSYFKKEINKNSDLNN